MTSKHAFAAGRVRAGISRRFVARKPRKTGATVGAVGLAGTLAAAPAAVASNTETITGITNTGPAMLILGVAAGLFLTLVLRPTIAALTRVSARDAARRRVRRTLAAHSKDVLEDFILPGAYGGLTRIDYAILTGGGVVCLWSRSWHGTVFGGDNEPQWSCVDGSKRQRFLNPVIQNEGRRRAVARAIPDVPVASLVVFCGKVEFATPRTGNVIKLEDLDAWLDSFRFDENGIEDWDVVWLKLKSAAMTDAESRRDFAAQLSFS